MANITQFVVLFLIIIGGVAAYAGATNTIAIGDGNSTVIDDTSGNATNYSEPIEVSEEENSTNVTEEIETPAVGNGSGNATNPVIINNNNNYIDIDNNIEVPVSIQPTITPTNAASDDTLEKVETVETKTVATPTVVKQKTVTVKTVDLYTGQLIKLSEETEVKKGLEITEVNTGKTGCEYIVVKNNNDFDMGLGGYTVYIDETETGIRLPNFEIAAGKSVKMFTVNGKPDTFDKDGDLEKFHFRLACELYPDDEKVNIFLIEPNFNEAISQIETEA